MTRRVLHLREREWPLDDEAPPLLVPGPIDEMGRLASGLNKGDLAIVMEGRQRLQNSMVAELQRLVGEFVTEVEAATTLYQKVGRAFAVGRKLEESRPPQYYVQQCVDPEGFVRLCRNATDGLVRFMTAEINTARDEAGQAPLSAALAEAFVRTGAQDLHEALELSAADGLDRMSELAVRFARTFETGAHSDGADGSQRGHS